MCGRTILLGATAQDRQLATELEIQGARVISWPRAHTRALEDFSILDEAIGNLFGYDWIIFGNIYAVEYFLRRFYSLGHETSKLDELRVCAIGEATVQTLSASQVHIDLPIDILSVKSVTRALESYFNESHVLQGVNFLIPSAAITAEPLHEYLREAGARVDVVRTYRTTSDSSGLTQLKAILAGDGIDCAFFTCASEITDLTVLFDTNDLSQTFAGVAIGCIDPITTKTAASHSLRPDLLPDEPTPAGVVQLIALHFSR